MRIRLLGRSGRRDSRALRAFGPQYRGRLAAIRPAAGPAEPGGLVGARVLRATSATCSMVQRGRLALALAEDCPDVHADGPGRARHPTTATTSRIRPWSPPSSSAAADAIAAAFAALDDDQWDRTGIYNYPKRTERTMLWLGQHTIHEGRHHLGDIDRVLLGRRDRLAAHAPGRRGRGSRRSCRRARCGLRVRRSS